MAKKTNESWNFVDFMKLSKVNSKEIGFMGRSDDRKSFVIRFWEKGSNKVVILKAGKDGSVYGRTNVDAIAQMEEVKQTISVI